MEIVLDKVVPQKDGTEIVYLHLMDGEKIIGTKSVLYTEDEKVLKETIVSKFSSVASTQQKKESTEQKIIQLLGTIIL